MASADEHEIAPPGEAPETGSDVVAPPAADESALTMDAPARPAASSDETPMPAVPAAPGAPVESTAPADATTPTTAADEAVPSADAEIAAESETPPPAEEKAVDAAEKPSVEKPSVTKPSITKRHPEAKSVRWRRVVVIVAKVVGIVVAVALIAFIVGRWVITNDAERIQGAWRIDGADTAITITEDQIVLSEDLTFDYVIDPFSKTITFYFSDLEGDGHYRFSLDGDRLAIQDGDFSAWDTFASDLPASIGELTQGVFGISSPLFGDGENVTNLTRITEKNPTGAASYGDKQEPPPSESAPNSAETLGHDPASEAGTGAV